MHTYIYRLGEENGGGRVSMRERGGKRWRKRGREGYTHAPLNSSHPALLLSSSYVSTILVSTLQSSSPFSQSAFTLVQFKVGIHMISVMPTSDAHTGFIAKKSPIHTFRFRFASRKASWPGALNLSICSGSGNGNGSGGGGGKVR